MLTEFVNNIKTHPQVTKLYIGYDVLPSGEEEAVLLSSGIEIITIPDYYYDELWR